MYKLVKEVSIERKNDDMFYMECEGTKLHIEFDQCATPEHVERTMKQLSNAIQPRISYYFGK